MAYLAGTGGDRYRAAKVKLRLYIDGTAGSEFETSAPRPIAASPDGKHYAIIHAGGRKGSIIVDGVEGKTYDVVYTDTLRFSSDSATFSYFALEKGNYVRVTHTLR